MLQLHETDHIYKSLSILHIILFNFLICTTQVHFKLTMNATQCYRHWGTFIYIYGPEVTQKFGAKKVEFLMCINEGKSATTTSYVKYPILTMCTFFNKWITNENSCFSGQNEKCKTILQVNYLVEIFVQNEAQSKMHVNILVNHVNCASFWNKNFIMAGHLLTKVGLTHVENTFIWDAIHDIIKFNQKFVKHN